MLEKVNGILAEMNQAVTDGNTNLIPGLNEKMKVALEEANAEIKATKFADILANENPALEVCKVGFVMLTTCKPDKETGGFKLGEKMEVIDFQELAQVSPNPIYVNAQWLFWTEALNHAVYGYSVKTLGITEKSKKLQGFKESATAAMLGISVDDMKTTKGLTSALQKVVDSIVEGQKVSADDAMALLLNYSRWSGKAINGVSMTIEANFRRMIMRVLYKIVNNGEYIAE